MSKVCVDCGREFKNGSSLGGHRTHCKMRNVAPTPEPEVIEENITRSNNFAWLPISVIVFSFILICLSLLFKH